MKNTEQLKILKDTGFCFDSQIRKSGAKESLFARSIRTLQVNLGRKCNMSCAHCHVDANTQRIEMMDKATVAKCLSLIKSIDEIETVDITGGAPEMNRHFRYLVQESRQAGKNVIDRCNLTILEEPGYEYLAQFLAENSVAIIASLPHYEKEITDTQRGSGTYEKSISALKKLNKLGYGTEQELHLVYNPHDFQLSAPQATLERRFKERLKEQHSVCFNNLYCINNVPVNRYLQSLLQQGELTAYFDTLINAFNSAAIDNLMCKDQISVGFDGSIFDCDFNQMLNITASPISNIDDFDYHKVVTRKIKTANHCWVCTAGAGSSCSGETVGA